MQKKINKIHKINIHQYKSYVDFVLTDDYLTLDFNSKNFDLRTRVPSQYLSKDIEIRKLLSSKLIRGKIDFTLQIDSEDLSD